MSDDDQIARIIAAHGGIQRWRAVRELQVDLSSGGLAFATKGVPTVLHDVRVVMTPPGHRVQLTGSSPRPWNVSFQDSNALETALTRLRTGTRRLRWGVADVAAFAAAAISTYISLPFLLTEPDVQVSLCEPTRRRPALQRLDVVLPTRVPTHCRGQSIHVDDTGLIRRHDYTALAIGRWARAAQILDGYVEFDGLRVATERVVHPRLPGAVSPTWPTLVWIRIHDVRIRD